MCDMRRRAVNRAGFFAAVLIASLHRNNVKPWLDYGYYWMARQR